MTIDTSGSSVYTSNSWSSKGISGLASGLDTEGMVEKMLAGAQAKIDKQNQKKQQLLWKQDIYRDIISKLESFNNKYFSATGLLRSRSLFNSMKAVSSSGAVKATASSAASAGNTTMHVAQLASAARWEQAGVRGDKPVEGTLDATQYKEKVVFDVAANGGTTKVSVDLSGTTTEAEVEQRLKDAFAGNPDTADLVDNISIKDGNLNISLKGEDTAVSINSASKAMGLKKLGLSADSKSSVVDSSGTKTNSLGSKIDLEAKATLTLTFNGESKSIDLPKSVVWGGADDLADYLRQEFKGFGDGLVIGTGTDTNGNDTIKIGTSDPGQTVVVTGNDVGLAAVGIMNGAANKVNFQHKLKDLFGPGGTVTDAKGETYQGYEIKINGESLFLRENAAIDDLVGQVNNNASKYGVKLGYDKMTGNFSIESTKSGKSGGFTIEDATGNVMSGLLGAGYETGTKTLDFNDASTGTMKEGQNAVVNINGVWTERSSNAFTENGITFTLSETTKDGLSSIQDLGYEKGQDGKYYLNGDTTTTGYTLDQVMTGKDASGNAIVDAAGNAVGGVYGELEASAAVKVTTERDTTEIVKAAQQFVDDYNALIEELNGYTGAEPNYKDYPPLTEAQKKEMSEKEIELWEKKAKEGLLRSDSEVSKVLSSMRSILYSRPDGNRYALYDIGIDTSSNYKDKGKLSFKEEDFLKALEEDPESVTNLFTNAAEGVSKKMYDALYNTAGTSAGSLRKLAGKKGGGDEKNNTLSREISSIDNRLEALKHSYDKEKSRYWRQFNAMEQMISQMNSQSMWLSQQLG